MPKFIDRTNRRYGRLLVLQQATSGFWLCLCDCGQQTIVQGGHLGNGHTKSCGCLKIEAIRQTGMAQRAGYQPGDAPIGRYGVCSVCGDRTSNRRITRCLKCTVANRSGENHPRWNKIAATATLQTGRDRARRRKTLDICEECRAAPAVDRHHRDGNPLNNQPDNLMGLCRRCHMVLDGRIPG